MDTKTGSGLFDTLCKNKIQVRKDGRREVFVGIPTPPFQVTCLRSSGARLPQAPLAFTLCLFCLRLCFGFDFWRCLCWGVFCSRVAFGLFCFRIFITQFTLREHYTSGVSAQTQVCILVELKQAEQTVPCVWFILNKLTHWTLGF